MPDYKPGIAWTDAHTVALVRAMVATVLSARPAMYDRPDLVQVANNGGSRINQKAQQLLKALAKSVPGAEDVVAEELAKLGRAKKTPTKKASGSDDGDKATPSPSPKKKRKLGEPVKLEMDEGEED